MRFEVMEDGADLMRIAMTGRLDAGGASAIELPFTATITGSGKNVLLDLSGVTFLASLGLRVLLAAARVAQRRGRRLVIYGAGPQAQEVFETISMETLVPVATDEAAARAVLAA